MCQFSYQKSCGFNPKTLHKTSAPTSQFWNCFILNLCSFHFHFVAIILHLWLMKFSMPEKWTYWTTFPCVTVRLDGKLFSSNNRRQRRVTEDFFCLLLAKKIMKRSKQNLCLTPSFLRGRKLRLCCRILRISKFTFHI
jgi:hypothetical protein